ncbi:hypothetical protein BY458DRAFT_440333 [Sporodiniella umbellata]|nr:hypothetical protein BY458DRAFT_440333 [Sporodiniella umbellata]
MEPICEIVGQVRHRRKLAKQLFFIDIQQVKSLDKSQVFFRSDDDSLTIFEVQEAYKTCKPGTVIKVQVGYPQDPSEQLNKGYRVWQSSFPVEVIKPYISDNPFIQDTPLATAKEKNDLRQGNGTRVAKSDILCKFWINGNVCVKGIDCPFFHPKKEQFKEQKRIWVAEKAEKLAQLSDPNDPHTSKQPHALRAVMFAAWIKKTFGLSSDSTVFDIAAGKGEVSMFLSRGFGIPSVAVEPQPRKRANYWFVRLRRLMHRYEEGSLEDSGWRSQPMMIDLKNWPSQVEPQFMHTYLDEAFIQEHCELVSKASLFVGLHPDQATIPIVDMAIKTQKPFAVIPCCVFSQENQTRKLLSGEIVMTTDQLIKYICEKDVPSGKIKTDYLAFEGKNKVVYWEP